MVLIPTISVLRGVSVSHLSYCRAGLEEEMKRFSQMQLPTNSGQIPPDIENTVSAGRDTAGTKK